METPGSTRGPKADLGQRSQEMRVLVALQGAASGCSGTGASQPPRPLRCHGLPDVPQSKAGRFSVSPVRKRSVRTGSCSPACRRLCRRIPTLTYNKLPTKDDFGEGRELVAATESLEVAIKKMEAKVHEQVKVCDMLLHQLKQWSQARDERQRRLQELQEAETDPKWQEPQLQTIRQLGNDIEKMLMKIQSGEIMTKLYLRLQEVLRRELVYLPRYLDLLCGMTVMYHEELTARSSLKANDAIRKLMAEAGPQVRVEKHLRDQSLAEQRKHIESLRRQEESERQQRQQAVSMLSAEHDQSSSEVLAGADMKAAMAKMEREAFVTDKMEKAKAALQCSCLWDIPSSIQAQRKSLLHLQQHIDECSERKKELKKTLQELELKQAKVKFNQPVSTTRCCWPRTLVPTRPPPLGGTQAPPPPPHCSHALLLLWEGLLREEELRENLKQEEARLEQMRAQMLKNQQRLIEFENIIDNLFLRLQGIVIPGQEDAAPVVGLEEKLQHCEKKMQFLKEKVAARPEDSTDERSEVQGTHTGPSQVATRVILLSKATGKGHGAAQPRMALGTHGVPHVAPLGCDTHPPSSTKPRLSQTFAKVRNLLEKRTAGETQNLKISFKDEGAMEDGRRAHSRPSQEAPAALEMSHSGGISRSHGSPWDAGVEKPTRLPQIPRAQQNVPTKSQGHGHSRASSPSSPLSPPLSPPDTLDFDDEDHDYVPSREDIKKQGLQLIRMKTRRRKK
ncbi:coiled-coil domain-containing protein 183-like [Poecile atricapillus]|uniref:coiled-coil domain-containing protein 183-like n=1 Tax=Poecile atricapillus TaxID=48891 RepID=UPI00273920D1|nr:coiled-coil domain-containing protein 183-like [Poecile atricapillus]